MEELKKGITLISLVVTIIVLLILAGITINLTIGQGGVIIKAVQAGKETKRASIIESIRLKIIESSLIENNQISESNVRALLGKYGTIIEKDGQIESLQIEDGVQIGINEIIDEKIVYSNNETTTYIYTKEQLEKFRDAVNSGQSYEGKVVKLMDNIDLKCNEQDESTWWSNIGSKIYPFDGIFDGNGYKISNIYIYDIKSVDVLGGGLFRSIKNATIKNVTVSGRGIAAESGSIAGIVYASLGECIIQNCCNQVNLEKDEKGREVAGILGVVEKEANVKIIECKNEGTMIGGNNTGGILGINYGSVVIENCINSGTIENFVGSNAGGIAGRDDKDANQNIVIKNCTNEGTVKGMHAVGGAIGRVNIKVEVDGFYNKGDIYQDGGISSSCTGGCIGLLPNYSNAKIYNVYNEGKINSKDFQAGGIIGKTETEFLSITNCFNKGEITAPRACGIIGGYGDGENDIPPAVEITNCYQTGNLIGEGTGGVMIKSIVGNILFDGVYYLNTTSDVGIRYYSQIIEGEDTSEALTQEFMISKEFVNLLNKNIEGKEGLKKWKYNLNDYPTFE